MDEGANSKVRFVRPVGVEVDSPKPAQTEVSRSMRDRLVRLAYRLLWNRDDAEDVVHDALVKAHQRHAQLRSPEKWWSWACRIVVLQCHTHGRRKQRRERHVEPYGREVRHRAAAVSSAEPSLDIECLRELLAALPRRQREVVVLRHLEGMGYDEIAEVLGIAPSTARVHAQAGRETLRNRLIAGAPDFFDEPSTVESGDP